MPICVRILVGTAGFEPAAFGPPDRHANQAAPRPGALRHVPRNARLPCLGRLSQLSATAAPLETKPGRTDAAPPRMCAFRLSGKLRCAGHGAAAVLVVHAISALAPKGRAVGSTGDEPLSLLRRRLPERGPDPPDPPDPANAAQEAVPDRPQDRRQDPPGCRPGRRRRDRLALRADPLGWPGHRAGDQDCR